VTGAATSVAVPPASVSPAAAPGIAAAFARTRGDGAWTLAAMVEGVTCGGCVARIERALASHPGVESARVNLSTRRLALAWRGGAEAADALAERVAALGFRLLPYDPERLAGRDAREERALVRAIAVAGFGLANVMLMSMAVWFGHVEAMDHETRALLHWFSALVALPCLAFGARPFFASAAAALGARRLNMDVPIAVGIVLTALMSLVETARGGDHAYFDSALALVFFLLIGRYLDRRARGRARLAAERLLALAHRPVTVVRADGVAESVPPERVAAGQRVLVAAGERFGVDGTVETGRSDVDAAPITGESLPVAAAPGMRVFAGSVNLTAPLTVVASAAGAGTLLAEIVRLMEAAEQRRGRFVVLADRVSRLYAPVVHLAALATFLLWWAALGAGWAPSLLNAIAVLIVTCPCALGLAVPAVQVIATGRLMKGGTLLKSATALERLAEIDTVVFDKTGTLTEGVLELDEAAAPDRAALAEAAALAGASTHPLARALCRAMPDAPAAQGVVEHPGAGLARETPAGPVRLGSRAFVGIAESADLGPELWLARPNLPPVRFAFRDRPRPDAAETLRALAARGLDVRLLSGDRAATVAAVAGALGIAQWRAAATPADKVAALEVLRAAGRRVLMVGDGLNDAPALAAAHVSASPASAADVSQNAADAVFQGARLAPVVELVDVARAARRLARQNVAASILYNAAAVPVAVAGLLTPLLAALAMSSSSLVVVLNALRLARGRRP
jgi:P-type Cu2+ transporter